MTVLRAIARWLGARAEALIPALGLLMLYSIVQWTGGTLSPILQAVIIGLALLYAGLVISHPMALPAKEPAPLTRQAIREAAKPIAAAVIGGTLIMAALSAVVGTMSDSTRSSMLGMLAALLLALILGTLGAAAERTLPVDLFPILRRREVRRILYALSACLFLALAALLWDNLWSGVWQRIGSAAGEPPPDIQSTTDAFRFDFPLVRLVQLLIGAGLIEELLFRVGIMTLVWGWTRRWGRGLVVSALAFGLYHISPLSGISALNLERPIATVLSSFNMGLVTGVVYRYRGFETAVLVHGLGDWVIVMLLASV